VPRNVIFGKSVYLCQSHMFDILKFNWSEQKILYFLQLTIGHHFIDIHLIMFGLMMQFCFCCVTSCVTSLYVPGFVYVTLFIVFIISRTFICRCMLYYYLYHVLYWCFSVGSFYSGMCSTLYHVAQI